MKLSMTLLILFFSLTSQAQDQYVEVSGDTLLSSNKIVGSTLQINKGQSIAVGARGFSYYQSQKRQEEKSLSRGVPYCSIDHVNKRNDLITSEQELPTNLTVVETEARENIFKLTLTSSSKKSNDSWVITCTDHAHELNYTNLKDILSKNIKLIKLTLKEF